MDRKLIAVTQAYLRSRLHYNKRTGVFTWRCHPDMPACWNVRFAGTEAGTWQGGYHHILISGRKYLAHRLAWFYVYGEQPEEIDHEDLDGSHNWLDNLRPATTSQNQHNVAKRLDNTSGYKGVTRHGKGWRARIRVRGEILNIGTYDTPEAAGAAYIKAAKKYHKKYARWGSTVNETVLGLS